MGLTRPQVDALLHPIAGARVSKNREGLSHVEAYDVRRRLTNIFGFGGWSGEVIGMELIGELPTMVGKGDKQKPGVTVGYRCTYRLTIHATDAVYTETAAGDGTMGENSRWDAHDFAMKTAESQALKRCAINLGDQFGLSLYNKGSLAPLVVYVLGEDPAKWTPEGIVRPTKTGLAQVSEGGADVKDHVTEQLAPEDPAPADVDSPPEQAAEPAQPIPDSTSGPTPEDDYAEQVKTIAGDPSRTKTAKRAALSKLLMKAQREGLTKRYVLANSEGDAVTLEALVQQAVAAVGRE